MVNLSDILADLSISRGLLLERVKAGLSKEVANLYDDMIKDITRQIKSGKEINQARLKATIKDIKDQLRSIEPILTPKLKDLAEQEANWTINSTNKAVGFNMFATIPKESTLQAFATTSLIEGATISAWIGSLNKSMAFDAQRAIVLGVSLGETNAQLAQRLADSLNINKRQAETIAITGAATVSNQARQKVYEANEGVIKGYEHLSVLDSSTTLICSTRDGAMWSVDGKGLNAKGKKFKFQYPPLHWRCRSKLVPIIKSWRDLGIDLDEIPQGTRASMDGQVSAGTTFDEWFSNKSPEFQKDYLGKGRYELYKKGTITFNDLVSGKGNELTLKELRERYS